MKYLLITVLFLSSACAFVQRRELIEITHFGPAATLESLGTFSEEGCYARREMLNKADDREIVMQTPYKIVMDKVIRLCVQEGAYPDYQVQPIE